MTKEQKKVLVYMRRALSKGRAIVSGEELRINGKVDAPVTTGRSLVRRGLMTEVQKKQRSYFSLTEVTE